MSPSNYQPGDLVTILHGKWQGYSGVVSWPVTGDEAGYVLVCDHGCVAGQPVAPTDIEPAGSSDHGYTQLAYQLIKLSSHLIEKAIL